MAGTDNVFDTSATIAAWTDDADWSLGAPPGEGDDASTSAYTGTIDYDEVSTIHSWGSAASTLDIEGGSLTLESAYALTGGAAVVCQGTLEVASGATFSLGADAGVYQIYNLENSGTVNIAAGATIEASGTIGGVVQGAGTLELTKSTITTSALDVAAIDFFADLVTLDVSLSFDVPFEIATDNNGIALNGNTLTLGGGSIALSGYINGPGAIDITGTATINSGFRDALGSGNTLVTLELSGGLTQTGAWSAAGDFNIDSSGVWSIQTASNLSDGGSLAIVNNGLIADSAAGLTEIINQTFSDNGTIVIGSGATLQVRSGGSGASATLNGHVSGAGALEIDENATLAANLAVASLEFLGDTATLGAAFTSYAGQFQFLAQSTVDLSGQTVTLSGDAIQLENAGTVEGPGVLKITGAATVGGNSFITGATLEDAGSIIQNGQFGITYYTANSQTYSGELLIDQGATYTFAAASVGLTNGSASDTIVNNGLLDINGANNSNLDHLVNNSTITIESTNFQFEGQTNINDDVIDVVSGSLDSSAAIAAGAGKTGLIEIAAGASATFNVGVAGQIVTFDGGSASVTLNSAGSFTSTIAGFSDDGDQIVLSGKTIASVTLSGPNASTGLSTLTAKSSNGQTLASLSVAGDFAGLIPIVVNGDAIELTTQHADDFTGAGYSDVAFENENGTIATWLLDGSAVNGGATLGAPGPDWSVVATGDLAGTGVSDFVFQNSSTGEIAVWQMANDAVSSAYGFSGPGGSWKIVGTGDFTGDGSEGLLLRDDSGELAVWNVANGQISGGEIGNPGAGWTFVGTGDFNGDGKTDLLFENAGGDYAVWNLNDNAITGAATLGSPGQGYVYVATGDFTGNGTSDVLFENTSTGGYEIWNVSDDAVDGVGVPGTPGPDWVVKGVGNYWGGAMSDVLFENVVTGQYVDWQLDDFTVTGGGAVGDPGPSWSVVGAPPAAQQELPGTIFFQNTSGEIAAWTVEGGSISGSAFLGEAPGYTLLGVGDFTGGLQPDALFENASGQYAIWETNGSGIVGGGTVGAPGGTWQFAAIGDFDGSGRDGILFQDASGDLATWDLDGTSIVNGGVIGNPGAGWTFEAAADFTGDGTSDLLFENTSGEYAIWDIGDNAFVGGGDVGSPGTGWTFLGAGDFNGDGKADLLFESASGTYATWDLSGTAIVGGGSIGSPGSQWQFAGIADIFGDHQDSILFYNASTGAYATWNMSDTTVASVSTLGAPGAAWTEKAFV